MTNTQPDFSQVGNAAILDRTIRTHNWIRTDTIFIENRQIEALTNRPPWIAAFIEKSMADVINEKGEENPLFMEIRRQGVRREVPLIIFTLKALAEGKLRVMEGKVINE